MTVSDPTNTHVIVLDDSQMHTLRLALADAVELQTESVHSYLPRARPAEVGFKSPITRVAGGTAWPKSSLWAPGSPGSWQHES